MPNREEVVSGPSLDPVPEAVHASERSVVRGEEVCSVSEYGEEEATGDPMAKERSDARPRGGGRLTKEKTAWARESLCL